MTLDCAVALSLLDDLPRSELTARLVADDPQLVELAEPRLAHARSVRNAAAARGVHVLPWNASRMPASLLAIADCPPAIWYRGTLDCFDAPGVAIVGSRAASHVAIETAERLAAGLAAYGVTVISGLARGVDSAAHRGALTTGRTLAVLGSGVDRVYPAEHAPLAEAIARTGAVISEYPPGALPLPFHFPMRNRLISGLARGVVVIEASEKSGSLITAACALAQGRDVMAVPGNVLSGRNRGGHALIRDGARIVECAEDVMEELALLPPSPGQIQRAHDSAAGNASDGTSATSTDPVLRRMDVGQPYDLDALAGASGLGVRRLLPHLAALELQGLVRRVGGGRFVRPA
jgi:DNA processing protein